VKVNDVVDRAGTTTGSLCWFFENRQRLINTAWVAWRNQNGIGPSTSQAFTLN